MWLFQFSLTYFQTQKGITLFVAEPITIFVLIEMDFEVI